MSRKRTEEDMGYRFREELIRAIVEVAQNTGLPLRQCIAEAKKMLRQQIKEHCKQQTEKQLFKGC